MEGWKGRNKSLLGGCYYHPAETYGGWDLLVVAKEEVGFGVYLEGGAIMTP